MNREVTLGDLYFGRSALSGLEGQQASAPLPCPNATASLERWMGLFHSSLAEAVQHGRATAPPVCGEEPSDVKELFLLFMAEFPLSVKSRSQTNPGGHTAVKRFISLYVFYTART